MARVGLILYFAVIAFTIFAFIDCIRTRDEKIRALPKAVWALIILLLPGIGAILWFALGKARAEAAGRLRASGPRAPDDDPVFLRRLGEQKKREETIKELERRLAELDDDSDGPKS